ncbi:MinD/ParA family protein [Brevibacillus daliensis]|uniref:MinD/ParA family protein n=1 Tax=Brevibacillus daliensis TaxID=2892995 RepID=UPI001E48B90C|nr:MinD/ParA family protein [Brevibacillus daliensis]
MNDQAQRLREQIQEKTTGRSTRLVAVTSGKGGVGKSNVTLNFALGLIEKGQKVLLFDVDLGLANLDVLMGITPKKNLMHLLEDDKTIFDIIEKGPNGLEFIAGGSGFTQFSQLEEWQLGKVFTELTKLQGYADVILFDTGAGITKESLQFILAADEILLVTTPEPPAITDAYAMMKVVHMKKPDAKIKLVINRATSTQEGEQTAEKLTVVAEKFLGFRASTLGMLPDDQHVSKAVKQQRPFIIAFPYSPAAKGIRQLVSTFCGTDEKRVQFVDQTGLKGFLTRLRKWM